MEVFEGQAEKSELNGLTIGDDLCLYIYARWMEFGLVMVSQSVCTFTASNEVITGA